MTVAAERSNAVHVDGAYHDALPLDALFVRDIEIGEGQHGRIVVEGADGKEVKVYAVDGKQVPNVNLIPGAYMVKVGNLPIRKVVVTKSLF